MCNKSRGAVLTLLVMLAVILCMCGAEAQDWQEAYAGKLRESSMRRAVALLHLTGSEAPEMAVVSVSGESKATVNLFRYKNGKAVACDVSGSFRSFEVSEFVNVKMQLRADAKGNPCLHISMKSQDGGGVIALAGDGSGGVKTVYNVVTRGSSYIVDGEKGSEAQYIAARKAYNDAYAKQGAALPMASIASTAAKKTITQKVKNLSEKYEAYVTVKRVKLDKETLAMTAGQAVKLSAKRAPLSAIFAQARWSSSDKQVAVVDQTGAVTALSSGVATITCQIGEASALCQVSVTGDTVTATGLELNYTSATLIKGERLALSAQVLPLGVSAKVKWASSNPKVAFVDSDGSVLAMSKGKAVITAKTKNGQSAKCTIVVNNTHAVIVDISQHNAASSIDWEKVAKSTHLLILRCGVTRTETAPLGIGKDDCFPTFAAKCKQYGIPFGVYYYGKCSSVEQAQEEAKFTWEIASPYKPLFYVYDCEEKRLNKAKIEAYMTTLQSLGAKKTGYYIAHNLYNTYKLDTSLVDFIWIPHYGKNTGQVTSTPSYPCDLHQYTSLGTVSGFSGKVDVSRLMGGKPLSWFTAK